MTDFYSINFIKDAVENNEKKIKQQRSKKANVSWKSTMFDLDMQKTIWNLPPLATDSIAGKLSLCLHMPVMIRNNDATELCITKGQEGFVAGWQTIKGPFNQLVLETLFVRLDNPPTQVQFDGLPVNVVPIVRQNVNVTCELTDDSTIQIQRQQVPVLPNFAMTDYASQGKTRQNNVVDLNHCKTHQAYYTALSRSSFADRTVLLGALDVSKITGGIDGWLHQEFRHMEILDEITTLRFENKLPSSVYGSRRWTLIETWYNWRGSEYMPQTVHSALSWSGEEVLQCNDADT